MTKHFSTLEEAIEYFNGKTKPVKRLLKNGDIINDVPFSLSDLKTLINDVWQSAQAATIEKAVEVGDSMNAINRKGCYIAPSTNRSLCVDMGYNNAIVDYQQKIKGIK